MHLHLVGGFLGSGKTTAIIAAARQLMAQGKKVGVVTNDQGKYLVDTAFFKLSGVPAVEVTGGCFCCNYGDLEASLNQLRDDIQPDVVFAESVGSCGDLVATVIKPLVALRGSDLPPTSFSVFADSRLLELRLAGEELPFSENVVYIFDKQIEEAPLLVINKIDLLAPEEIEAIYRSAEEHYPGKTILLSNSLDSASIQQWVEFIESGQPVDLPTTIEMDYARYGDGEAQLAWLDEQLHLTTPDGEGRQAIVAMIAALLDALQSEHASIGHLKFLVSADGVEAKISFPTLVEADWQARIPFLPGTGLVILVNARVEISAERLRKIIHGAMQSAIRETGAEWVELKIDAFHPGFPNPSHRMA